MKAMVTAFIVLLCLPVISQAGNTKIYPQPYDAVFDAVVESVEDAGYAVVEENRDTGRVRTDYQAKSNFLGMLRRKWAVRVKEVSGGTKVRAVCSGGAKASTFTATALDVRGGGWDEMSEKDKRKATKAFFKHLDKKLK